MRKNKKRNKSPPNKFNTSISDLSITEQDEKENNINSNLLLVNNLDSKGNNTHQNQKIFNQLKKSNQETFSIGSNSNSLYYLLSHSLTKLIIPYMNIDNIEVSKDFLYIKYNITLSFSNQYTFDLILHVNSTDTHENYDEYVLYRPVSIPFHSKLDSIFYKEFEFQKNEINKLLFKFSVC